MRLTIAKIGPVEGSFIFATLALIVVEPIAFQTSLSDAGTDDMGLLPEALDGLAQFKG